jgi:hypothetical protein
LDSRQFLLEPLELTDVVLELRRQRHGRVTNGPR